VPFSEYIPVFSGLFQKDRFLNIYAGNARLPCIKMSFTPPEARNNCSGSTEVFPVRAGDLFRISLIYSSETGLVSSWKQSDFIMKLVLFQRETSLVSYFRFEITHRMELDKIFY
jgi:hypothetical protein